MMWKKWSWPVVALHLSATLGKPVLSDIEITIHFTLIICVFYEKFQNLLEINVT